MRRGDCTSCGSRSTTGHQGNDIPCLMGAAAKRSSVACDCDRWLEIWNLVFMQLSARRRRAADSRPPPSIDTGAGLLAIASVLRASAPTTTRTCSSRSSRASSRSPESPQTRSERTVLPTASSRTSTARGVPHRGRRAALSPTRDRLRPAPHHALRDSPRHAAGPDQLFFKVVDRVIELMGDAYPELRESALHLGRGSTRRRASGAHSTAA